MWKNSFRQPLQAKLERNRHSRNISVSVSGIELSKPLNLSKRLMEKVFSFQILWPSSYSIARVPVLTHRNASWCLSQSWSKVIYMCAKNRREVIQVTNKAAVLFLNNYINYIIMAISMALFASAFYKNRSLGVTLSQHNPYKKWFLQVFVVRFRWGFESRAFFLYVHALPEFRLYRSQWTLFSDFMSFPHMINYLGISFKTNRAKFAKE